MKKNILIASLHLLFIFLLLLLFSAPGEKENNEGEKFTGVLERNVIIRVLENDTAIEQGYFKELLSAFNEKYSEYGIIAVDANMDQYLDLEKDGPYGYGPDVLYQANDALMKYVDGRHILPLPVEKLNCYEEISDNAWAAYTASVDGEDYICGLPVNIQGPVLYYRKDLLPSNWKDNWDENNNDIPDMVETWNSLYQYSKQVKNESNNSKYGYMKSLNDVYFASGYFFTYDGYVFGNNNTDISDIGFSNGESEKGGQIIRQLASQMNQECIDDTITKNAYAKIANSDYFATMTTPDVYSMFITQLAKEYMKTGLSEAEAIEKALENLVVANVPYLPQSGDLTDASEGFFPSKMMGGVNGYAISSYTKAPNACLEFINFATSYEMIKRRNEVLGIAPARFDVAQAVGGLSVTIYKNLDDGNIVVMPSVRAIGQVWDPMGTFLAELASDVFTQEDKQKYNTLEKIKKGLIAVDKQIYEAIHSLN